jgi:hypothetical protein
MAFSHGSKAVCKVSDSGATLRDVSAYLTSAGSPFSADVADVTALGNLNKAYIPGLKDGKISLAGSWDPTVDGYIYGVLGGTAAPFEYYPAGTATTNVKYSGSAICTAYDVSSDVGDANKFSAEFQITGAVTRAVL